MFQLFYLPPASGPLEVWKIELISDSCIVPTCQSAGQPCVVLYTQSGRVHIQTGLCDGLPIIDHLHFSYLLSPALCMKARTIVMFC